MMPTEASGALSSLKPWLRGFCGPWQRRRLLQAVVACLVATALGVYAGDVFRMRDAALPGVRLDGGDIGGYRRDFLERQLRARREALNAAVLRVAVGEQVFPLPASRIEAELLTATALESAMTAGRSLPVWKRWLLAAGLARTTFDVEVQVAFDEALWEREVQAMEQEALDLPSEGAVHYKKGRVVQEPPRAGAAVDRAAALAKLVQALKGGAGTLMLPLIHVQPKTTPSAVEAAARAASELIVRPVTLRPLFPPGGEPKGEHGQGSTKKLESSGASGPSPTDPAVDTLPEASHWDVTVAAEELGAALYSEVDPELEGALKIGLQATVLEPLITRLRESWTRPAQDARFVIGRRDAIEILPDVQATTIDADEVAKALVTAPQQTSRVVAITVHLGQKPELTYDKALALGIKRRVAEFATYHPCCRPRVKNIHRIADLINGTVVLPGQLFSLNEHIGERRARKGFVPAPTIVLGEMRDTVGGGISQFATTIYNAVFDGGYEIVERQPHSYYFTRYPIGHEATVSFPKPDFIFRNDTHSGLLVTTQYGATFIKVVLYGDNDGRKVKRRVSPRYDWVEPELEYVANPELEPGKERAIERGERGFSVDVARVLTLADGQVQEQERKVVYKPRARVVEVHPCELPDDHPDRSSEPCPEGQSGDEDAGSG